MTWQARHVAERRVGACWGRAWLIRKGYEMKCPYCFKDDNIILETKERKEWVWRRRKCLCCNQKFTTKEKFISERGNVR